jgi:N-acetyl-gamma-glutamyl-phosphate reductase
LTYKVFVDGQEGTTGLRIHDYLAGRPELEVLKIEPDKRKDPEARRIFLNQADIAFLCLPDVAAKEAVALIDTTKTRVIDASTAHRTNEAWTYGLPELNKNHRELIRNSHRVSVPGCHATGFVLAVNPLIQEGILASDAPLTCHSITGYSGGGNALIHKYEQAETAESLNSPRIYGLKLTHKHLPEMQKIPNLLQPPVFTPIVANYYQGMAVCIPLPLQILKKKLSAEEIRDMFQSYYANEAFIRVMPYDADSNLEEGFFNAEACNNTNRADIFVFGHERQTLLVVRIDNLGKGASGAAIQNMNLMLGLDEGLGLKR